MFWGIRSYNEMLLQDGNVQTEMILEKSEGEFTFSGGWAFPRRVYFDGHECVTPPADQYPALPNGAPATRRRSLRRPSRSPNRHRSRSAPGASRPPRPLPPSRQPKPRQRP